MSTIRLENDKFASASELAGILESRLLKGTDADSDLAGDPKSTIYVCSAASKLLSAARKRPSRGRPRAPARC